VTDRHWEDREARFLETVSAAVEPWYREKREREELERRYREKVMRDYLAESDDEPSPELPPDPAESDRLPPGRPRQSDAEAEARLQAELVRWRENGGEPSLRSIQRRLKRLGYEVSWRRVLETSLEVWPRDQRPH
jgi:hypothetical protein